jgi:uracil-DNA glycosylase family 4
LADVFLLKYRPRNLEVNEGVAFYGRSGTAVLKSLERLGVNPLIVYGSNLVKCHDAEARKSETNCPVYWLEEFHITQPRMLVVMGRQALDLLNSNRVAGMKELAWEPGVLQDFTPFCRALVTPDIDDALDEEQAKASFWKAFRSLGDWVKDEPPY